MKARAQMFVIQDNIVIHRDGAYHDILEVAVHQDCARIHKFFADDMEGITSYIKATQDDRIEFYVMTPQDHAFRKINKEDRPLIYGYC